MSIKNLDFISPPITLYFRGLSSHKSTFSGILTISVTIITLSFGIYFSQYFFQKKNPQVFTFNRYIENAGNYAINSESMFSFIQLTDIESNLPDSIDFDAIRIIGTELDISLFEKIDLSKYDHWIYGNCNNDTDTKGISELINFDKFNESACIKKYYKKDDNKYYNTNEANFRWPILKYGCSHPNRTFYGIIVEKCKNDSLRMLSNNKWCKSKNEIIQYVQTKTINFQILDQFVDILSYDQPLIKYFYDVSNGMFENSFTTNHLNFNPLTIITKEGIFFDTEKSILSYDFEQNEKVVTSKNNTNIYAAFYFWLQNRKQYHERNYEKLQDTLSSIGGLWSTLLILSRFINLIIFKFVCINDIEEFLTEISTPKKTDQNMFKNFNKTNNNINSEIKNNENNNYNNINSNNNICSNNINCEAIKSIQIPKNEALKNSLESDSSSVYLKLFKESMRINNITVKKSTKDNINFIAKRYNTINEINSKKNLIQINKLNNNKIINTNITQKIPIIKENNINNQKVDKNKENMENENAINNNTLNKQIPKKKKKIIKFLDFVGYKICLGKEKNKTKEIKFYDNFRRKIISEEIIILNYFNICKIIQM